ncbi:TolC family protein [Bacteroidota bacterium]
MPVKTNAQKVWSLEECIQYAIDNNIRIQQQENITSGMKKNVTFSKLAILPSLNANLNHNYSFGRTLNVETYEYVNTQLESGGIGANTGMTLFSGLQNLYRIQQSKYDHLSSLEDLQLAKNDISISISGAYLNILLDQELLDVAEKTLEVSKQQLNRERIFYEEGARAISSVLLLQSQVSGEELAVTNAKNSLKYSILTLTQLLRLPSTDNFQIQDPGELLTVFPEAITSVNSVYEYASKNMPQIIGAEYRMKSSEKSLAISRASLIPSISIGASYSSRYNELKVNPTDPYADYPYIEQLKDLGSEYVGFGLNIPIYNRMQSRRSILQAKIQAMNSKLDLDAAKQTLYQQIQQSYNLAITASDKYKSSESLVSSAKEAFNFIEKQYEVGLVTSIEYNVSKNELTRAESILIQSKYEYVFYTKMLDFYKGKQITL